MTQGACPEELCALQVAASPHVHSWNHVGSLTPAATGGRVGDEGVIWGDLTRSRSREALGLRRLCAPLVPEFGGSVLCTHDDE